MLLVCVNGFFYVQGAIILFRHLLSFYTTINTKNAKELGINLNDIDFFIISHGHYDHFGGIHNIQLEKYPLIYGDKQSQNDFYYKFYGIKKSIGNFKESEHKLKKADFDFKYKISENIYLVKSHQKNKNSNFFIKNKQDNFDHEINLVIIEDKKLNIVTGCCHSGILNLLKTLTILFPDNGINSLVGGIHTRSYFLKPTKLIKLIKKIKTQTGIKMFLGHCTGKITLKIFSLFLDDVEKLQVGKKINI